MSWSKEKVVFTTLGSSTLGESTKMEDCLTWGRNVLLIVLYRCRSNVRMTYVLKKITGENIDCYLGGEISLNPVGVFDKLTVCRLPQLESILLLLEE